MKGFRNICFIHSQNDSYEVCYLKQFFKWIGFSYLTYTPGSVGIGMDILRKPENQGFDIVVSLNQVAQRKDPTIADVFGNKFLDLDVLNGQSEEELLEQLIDKIGGAVLGEYSQNLLKQLANIYTTNRLVVGLYEYTIILMETVGESLFEKVRKSMQDAISQLEDLLGQVQQENGNGNSMIEYLLYAKFSCQRRINELWQIKRWMPEYPISKMLEDLEEIYQYDRGFYRVEFLKAKVAEQGLMYNVYAKSYYHKGINACEVELCRSYLFYQLGKWLDNNKQIYTSGQAYYRAYECNPTNIKAIFKLVVDAMQKKRKGLERQYLKLLIENWEATKEMKSNLPLMELEYAYKAYMLLDDLDRTSMQDKRYYSEAEEILKFTRELYLKEDKNYFIRRLYEEEDIKGICTAIASRMDINCREIKGGGATE